MRAQPNLPVSSKFKPDLSLLQKYPNPVLNKDTYYEIKITDEGKPGLISVVDLGSLFSLTTGLSTAGLLLSKVNQYITYLPVQLPQHLLLLGVVILVAVALTIV